MTEPLVIDMNPRDTRCHVCGAPCDSTRGVPMYEGVVLASDDPGPWAGHPACQKCFERQTQMRYVPQPEQR